MKLIRDGNASELNWIFTGFLPLVALPQIFVGDSYKEKSWFQEGINYCLFFSMMAHKIAPIIIHTCSLILHCDLRSFVINVCQRNCQLHPTN